MPYITSVERMGIKKGFEQGIQQDIQIVLGQTITPETAKSKSKTMEHAKLYYRIVKEENCDELYSIMSERLNSVGYRLVELSIMREKDFPYIYCQIKTDEIFNAQMIGFFVEISSMIPDYKKPYYYLPIVVFCEDYDDRIKGFIDKKISMQHELQHIKDILELIREYPDYPEKSYRYGMYSITEVEDISKSIDLEIFKLFYIEPPTMRIDFNKGEKFILMPFDDEAKKVVRYECDNIEEYVGINMHSYIMKIRHNYKDRFKNDEEASKIIDHEIDMALTCYGKNVFGQDPVKGMDELKKRSARKLLLFMLSGQFA